MLVVKPLHDNEVVNYLKRLFLCKIIENIWRKKTEKDIIRIILIVLVGAGAGFVQRVSGFGLGIFAMMFMPHFMTFENCIKMKPSIKNSLIAGGIGGTLNGLFST